MTAALLDAPGTVREENQFDPELILPFLRSQIADLPTGAVTLQQFSGGASNLTYLLTVGGREMILRRPPPGTKAKSAHDMGREFRILSALRPATSTCQPSPASRRARPSCPPRITPSWFQRNTGAISGAAIAGRGMISGKAAAELAARKPRRESSVMSLNSE